MSDTSSLPEDELFNSDCFLHNVSIDNVIFGYHQKELKVLLLRPQGIDKWTVCGGYIRKTETIDEAANRIARERTGLKDLYLKQFKAFGNPERTSDSSFSVDLIGELSVLSANKLKWLLEYFVSLGYYTLAEFDKVIINGELYTEECQWWSIQKLPPLLFDHSLIVSEALKSLRLDINHYPIGYELLPEKFTLPEITSLYETILDKKLDDRNFAKKLLATGVITKLNERRSIGPHRSPYLYVFNKEKYDEALKNGMALAL